MCTAHFFLDDSGMISLYALGGVVALIYNFKFVYSWVLKGNDFPLMTSFSVQSCFIYLKCEMHQLRCKTDFFQDKATEFT